MNDNLLIEHTISFMGETLNEAKVDKIYQINVEFSDKYSAWSGAERVAGFFKTEKDVLKVLFYPKNELGRVFAHVVIFHSGDANRDKAIRQKVKITSQGYGRISAKAFRVDSSKLTAYKE